MRSKDGLRPSGLCIIAVTLTLFIQGVKAAGTGTYCRQKKSRPNHMYSLWKQAFPLGEDEDQPSALCEGTVYEIGNGEICIEGRVSYQQVAEAIGNNALFQPAARTVSVNGHLIAGSGNVVLGHKIHYLYDFVTSYIVDGVTYDASTNIVDHMLTASRGTIDGVCFRSDFQEDESWYQISHKVFWLGNVDYDLLRESQYIGLLFFGNLNSVLEIHTPVEDESGLNAISTFPYSAIMNLANFAIGLFPASLYGILPVFAITGTSRLLIEGTFSTKDHPNPFIAPDPLGQVEGIQVDVLWTTLIDAIQFGGLFTTDDKKVPLYFNVVIKRIEAVGNNFNCWGQGAITAAIDLEAPAGWGDKLDDFVDNIVFPELKARGDVAIHFGKRSPPNSKTLQSAIDFYQKCGVEIDLNLTEDVCYHPICDRNSSPRKFTYPPAYYDDIPTV